MKKNCDIVILFPKFYDLQIIHSLSTFFLLLYQHSQRDARKF